MHTMDAIMKQLRQTPPTAIGGMAVESMVDYNTAGTGLPKQTCWSSVWRAVPS